MTDAASLTARLEELADAGEREKYRRYFPDDDSFIGVRMGAVFDLAKTVLDLPATEIERLLESDVHEVRALACSIMGKAASHRRATEERRDELVELMLRRHDRIDTWDLVDLVAQYVLGSRLLDRDRSVLTRLAASGAWPERRTAIVATFAMTRAGDLEPAFEIAELLVDDPHPLVQKAVGWALRAAGDVDRARLIAFVDEHGERMPRPALRAAIEKLPVDERREILARRQG